ncbi:MAG: hypothetical protein Q7N50_15275 [Armatimonadota bacterium]|nr:hypothetical protein [Armatimonadota bacterium]
MRMRKGASWSTKVVSAISELAMFGLKLGGLALVIVVGYIIYACQAGLETIGQAPAADYQRMMGNLAFACRAAGVMAIIVAVCAIILYHMEEVLGYILALLGALMYFATPFLFTPFAAGADARANAAVALILTQIRATGFMLFIPGLALVVRDLIRRIVNSISRPRISPSAAVWGQEQQTDLAVWKRIYGNCWDLPHCREFVRKFCPAYQAKSPCWRQKSGCYCDERTIVKAMQARNADSDVAKNAQFSHGIGGTRALTAAQKRARCRSCAIYAEHQRQKYRIISPLVFPAVALSIWVLSPSIQQWLQKAVQFTDHLMKYVSFVPQEFARSSGWTYQVSESATIGWLFIAWLSIMAVSYLLQLVEYFIFKVQI